MLRVRLRGFTESHDPSPLSPGSTTVNKDVCLATSTLDRNRLLLLVLRVSCNKPDHLCTFIGSDKEVELREDR